MICYNTVFNMILLIYFNRHSKGHEDAEKIKDTMNSNIMAQNYG